MRSTEERTAQFLEALEEPGLFWLEELEERQKKAGVPVIRPQMRSLLRLLTELCQPAEILEIGTAGGYSALVMARQSSAHTRIVTIEKDPARCAMARENFSRYDSEGKIRLMEGDALEVLGGMEGSFGLIFLDAAKGQYIHLLPDLLRLLKPGGILISDNVLQNGDLIESHYAVERRKRTIYHRMREYLYALQHTEGLLTCILPVGDGAALSVKTTGQEEADSEK